MNSTASSAFSSQPISLVRIVITALHLLLVSVGSGNLLVVLIILLKPYMRTITNVYMIGLCLANFTYLANLTLVAATQLNDKSWMFGNAVCVLYHGTESTGKYASVMFVVLLAADRYFAICKTNHCSRYRNYRTAVISCICAWLLAILAALPLYKYAGVIVIHFHGYSNSHQLCIANWPSSRSARLYITLSSIGIYVLPLILIVNFYYRIVRKLREAVLCSKRMHRARSSRTPYHRVTRLVLWVVVFHVMCWTPFWLFNLFSSILHLRIQSYFHRIIINIIHLFPYLNCALNPLLYATNAENFRIAFRSLLLFRSKSRTNGPHFTSCNAEDGRLASGEETGFVHSEEID
ncbi:hypothetical protein AB6A40_001406 [Gnathostoma spinigerum]|uniref:G-protein coupled receptors family 1 profile domain-containing protein n=1 Tax=Gnathostoma spinigerum TaxID=75299 RepID=A0ABD6E668_9BILA